MSLLFGSVLHKIGLKLWNINTEYYYDEAIKLYNNNIFDYIELYIVPGHLDIIDKWKKIDIPFDIHAPHFAHNMNLSKKEFENDNYNKYIEVKDYADALNANVIVFHGGINGDYKETARQIKNFNDSRILIENKPYQPLRMSEDNKCVGSKYEEIKYIVEESGCGFCLDIGHAICAANSQCIEPYSYIEKLVTLNPQRIHLSDIDITSKYDQHLNYGQGNLDFNRILSIVPKDINITIETIKSSKEFLNDYENDVDFLKQILRYSA